MNNPWSAYELVETFQLSHAVSTLHEMGILASLTKPTTALELSKRSETDTTVLEGILDYVAARTNLLRKTGKKFVVTRQYSSATRFLLDLYIGAYGKNAAQLQRVLRRPSIATRLVNHDKYTKAFHNVSDLVSGALLQIIVQLQLNNILDLGCGPATLLIELARKDRRLIGWGVEMSPAMYRLARARIRDAQLSTRIRVFNGDCRKINSVLPSSVLEKVGVVVASQVANEMFADGRQTAVAWLRQIRQVFPRRLLLIADYYGRLGRTTATVNRETLLHDYVQLISGQGIPPPDASFWNKIYSQSSCRLLHIIEDKATSRFIHVLEL